MSFFTSNYQPVVEKKDNGTKLISLWYPKDNSCLIKFRCNKLNCSSCTKISSRISSGTGAKQLSHLLKAVIFRKKRELRIWYCPMTKYRGKLSLSGFLVRFQSGEILRGWKDRSECDISWEKDIRFMNLNIVSGQNAWESQTPKLSVREL